MVKFGHYDQQLIIRRAADVGKCKWGTEAVWFSFKFPIKFNLKLFYPKIWSLWSIVNLSASSWCRQVQVRNWDLTLNFQLNINFTPKFGHCDLQLIYRRAADPSKCKWGTEAVWAAALVNWVMATNSRPNCRCTELWSPKMANKYPFTQKKEDKYLL